MLVPGVKAVIGTIGPKQRLLHEVFRIAAFSVMRPPRPTLISPKWASGGIRA